MFAEAEMLKEDDEGDEEGDEDVNETSYDMTVDVQTDLWLIMGDASIRLRELPLWS